MNIWKLRKSNLYISYIPQTLAILHEENSHKVYSPEVHKNVANHIIGSVNLISCYVTWKHIMLQVTYFKLHLVTINTVNENERPK